MSGVIEQLFKTRGIYEKDKRQAFLAPDFEDFKHDPFLLPDMQKAVERLQQAKQKNELIFIYGDYDIDGLTATSLLLDAFKSFGLRCEAFIPNRFVDGYGLSKGAIKEIAAKGANLIVTVDCGSLSHKEIDLANGLGMDVIVTDHHSVADVMPNAIATINPKRNDHNYPFIDLAGVGVAFKLVQAMQQKMEGLAEGQEKWLLDLVALGTVCDVVQLVDENRANVLWGLKVLQKTRRPGLRSIAQVTGLEMSKLNSRSLGFVIGPHLNAAGRLETAQHSLDLITADDAMKGLEIAYKLREMNIARRAEQDRIFAEAKIQAEQFANDPVLVLSGAGWSHGIIGIVAAKILEHYQKPTFVLEEMGEESKGSARSFGDFSAVEAIRNADQWLIKGGGHKLAAGITLKTDKIHNFRKSLNEFYRSKGIQDQLRHLEPKIDAIIDNVTELDFELSNVIKSLEPFGHGNPEPLFKLTDVIVQNRRHLGKDQNHLKLTVCDKKGNTWDLIGFGMVSKYDNDVGETIDVIFKIVENEWRGTVKLEGQLIKLM
ncbi:MAG TPA: single-stranded-DNA-specific exonuclease RecJ [Candidatus Saccharimonadales bacterium]|nr:single-stranded-DNA-specific exonuclease RecJ [Candidatus Saccharimonadales bacterium]